MASAEDVPAKIQEFLENFNFIKEFLLKANIIVESKMADLNSEVESRLCSLKGKEAQQASETK